MVLAPLELMYIWNYFKVTSWKPGGLAHFLSHVKAKLKVHEKEDDPEIYFNLMFLKGVVLSNSSCLLAATECFFELLDQEKQVSGADCNHLIPQSCFEVGRIYQKMNDLEEAAKWYKKARSYSGYLTEALIKYRIDCATCSLVGDATSGKPIGKE